MATGPKKRSSTLMRSKRSQMKHKLKNAKSAKNIHSRDLPISDGRALKAKDAKFARKAMLKKKGEKIKQEQEIEKEELEMEDSLKTGGYFCPTENVK